MIVFVSERCARLTSLVTNDNIIRTDPTIHWNVVDIMTFQAIASR